jgi:hypothetical protein
MMGHTHAVSGAMVWLAGCAGLAAAGWPATPWHVAAGTVVCAGAALLPDLDHPQATVARALGPITRLLAYLIARASAAVHASTRTGRDRPNGNGHRSLTHTAVFAGGLGAAVSVAGGFGGKTVAAVMLALTVALGLRGLAGKVRGDLNLLVPAIAVGAGAMALWVLPGGGWWWLGLPVAVGCLTHDLGDATTNSGCPILWPLRVDGQRWYRVGTPRLLRYAAGSWVEKTIVLPVLSVGAVACGAAIALV